ncbi:MAG: AarF/UbiB family protein [Acidimicrobiia bacterium]|jgi:ubiquinone biosynthesis protein
MPWRSVEGQELTQASRSRWRFARGNRRVALVRFLVSALLVALVLGLLPSIDAEVQAPIASILILAVIYALLDAFVRPLLNVWLMPFVVQSYGLALVAVDVLLVVLLLRLSRPFLEWLGNPLQVGGLAPIIVAGMLLGLLRLAAEAVLGLTPPVGTETSVQDATGGGSRRLSAGLEERLRLLRVYDTLWVYTLDAAFDRAGALARFRRAMQRWLWKPDIPPGEVPAAVRFRLLLQELGPTYVKIGQILSSQGRALPTDWEAELEKLQSEVRPFPYEDVRQRIIEELGKPPDEIYASFDTEPLAAASLAQVHRATLHDGTKVVVKVQRPGIRDQLRSDVRILVRLGRALERRTRWAHDVDLSGILLEFGTTLLRELDYTIEAYNARRLNRVLEPIEGLHVPDAYPELSSSKVLTLEFIDGVKPTQTEKIDGAGIDREMLGKRMVRGAIKMLVIDGFFHGDPHPGNVLVELGSGRLTMLDTGMVGELSLQDRIKLGSLMMVVRNRDVVGLAQTLRALSTPFRETDDAQFYKDFERKLSPYLDPPPGQKVELVSKVLPIAMDLLRDAGYRLNPQLTLAIKSMTQAEAITTALVPEWTGGEFTQMAVDATIGFIPAVVTPEAVRAAAVKQVSYVAREAAQQLPSFQEGAVKWLQNLRRGAVKVELDTTGLNEQVKQLRGIAMMLAMSILVVGLVIGSAIAAGVSGIDDSPLAAVRDFSLVVFAGASLIGGGAVLYLGWRLVRRDRNRGGPIDRL